MKLHKLSAVLLAGAAGSTILLSATAAGAAVTALPKGYTVATTSFIAFAGAQDAATAYCPGTKQAVGGGAIVSSSDLRVNINRSYPDPTVRGWTVSISNASASSTNVTAYAICMAYSQYYKVVASATATVNPDSVSTQAVACPANTSVLGGGAYSFSPATDVYMNSSVPSSASGGQTGWSVAMANSDPSTANFTVYAVCRPKPKGYSVQWGPVQQLAPVSEVEATVTCPGASVPLGGGGYTNYSTTDAFIAMNSSGPLAQGWRVYENNATDFTREVGAAVICAGT